MWSSSVDRECETAVALQAGRELKCQTVTAIVKPGGEGLARRVNGLKGLMKVNKRPSSEPTAQEAAQGFTGHVLQALLLLLN